MSKIIYVISMTVILLTFQTAQAEYITTPVDTFLDFENAIKDLKDAQESVDTDGGIDSDPDFKEADAADKVVEELGEALEDTLDGVPIFETVIICIGIGCFAALPPLAKGLCGTIAVTSCIYADDDISEGDDEQDKLQQEALEDEGMDTDIIETCVTTGCLDKDTDPSDTGDPLIFSLTGEPCTIRMWEEQHYSRLIHLDLLNNGEVIPLTRTLCNNTQTMYIDWNEDGELSDGVEWLWHENIDVYSMMNSPILDSNRNGWVDKYDRIWEKVMVYDGKTSVHASELNISGFNYNFATSFEDDNYGKGQYSDCKYEGVLDKNCIITSDRHFRTNGVNYYGILMDDDTFRTSFGMVVGSFK